jgi:hypothetical protein
MPGPVHRPARALLAVLATGAAALGLAVTGTGTAQAATALPSHLYAPYFEAYNGDSPAQLAAQSGNKYLTMAFLQTTAPGSCTPYWNGDSGMPVAQSTFGADIDTIQAGGGDVIPSFGGYAADNGGTDIADSCTNVASIAAAYEKVVTTYDVSRIDLDTEDNSLTNAAGIDRRNRAVKMVQDWAAANNRSLQFSYTLPTTTHGLTDGTAGDGSGLSVLRNAVSNGVKLDVVNIMTFDYYDNAAHDMAADTQTAAQGLHDELAALYPAKSDAQVWNMVGVTEMPGIDDFGAPETFTTANAASVYNWAVAKGINTISLWALQRDNGGCPGQGGSDSCSGTTQSTWQFSHTFEPFNGNTTPPANGVSVSLTPASGSLAPGGSTTSSVRTGFTGSGGAPSVKLSVSGAPKGVTASVSPGSVTAGGSATLSVSATTATAPGTYTLTVSAVAGSSTGSATYQLTVTGSGSCTAGAWKASSVYVGGDSVSYGGHTWKAKWWTQGEQPGTTGEWGVWQDLGAC